MQGLDAAGKRMLAPMRERALGADRLVEALALAGTEQVADVGSGPGFFSLRLARRVPQGRVVATDIDPVALEVLQRRAKAEGLTNIETRKVSADTPGLAQGAFDLIFLCQVDHYLADRTSYLRQLALGLKAGGRLVIANFEKYRDADRVAAEAAGLVAAGELTSAPGHFAQVWVARRQP